jgi:hypothetical protein
MVDFHEIYQGGYAVECNHGAIIFKPKTQTFLNGGCSNI